MLGEVISKALVIILGYAYPALECFKTLEKNRVDINDLRFWCQYWIIVALLSVCERFGDIFISWIPMYEELKLAFIIYLWYPKTKGTNYVYEGLLRPLVSKHETEIEKYLKDMRMRAWDLALYYYQNCTELGQGTFFQVIEYLLTQSQRLRSGNLAGFAAPEKTNSHQLPKGGLQPPPPPMSYIPPSTPSRGHVLNHVRSPRHSGGNNLPSSPGRLFRRWASEPSAPPMPKSTLHRSVAQSPRSKTEQLKPDEVRTEFVHVGEPLEQVQPKLRAPFYK